MMLVVAHSLGPVAIETVEQMSFGQITTTNGSVCESPAVEARHSRGTHTERPGCNIIKDVGAGRILTGCRRKQLASHQRTRLSVGSGSCYFLNIDRFLQGYPLPPSSGRCDDHRREGRFHCDKFVILR